MNSRATLGVFAALTLLSGCGESDAQPDAVDELAVDCGGKCDGLDSIRSLLRNPDDLDLGDLLDNGKDFARKELNELIASGDIGGLAVEFHTAEDLDGLVRDMAAAFGERELTTAVNELRLSHLASSSDTVYAETSFTLAASESAGWSLDVDGLVEGGNGSAGVGFDVGGSLQARVVSAHDAEVESPLARLQTLREFVLPTSVADLRKMQPGESFALRGEGHLGANLGIGVPLVIAEPTSTVTYSIVLSAGLRTRLGGALDIQLVRLGGSEVIVDVGIEKIKEKSAWLGLEDRWGVQGLLESTFDIAGIEVDLGRLVDNALQRQLDDRLQLIDAHAERTTESSRMTVARLRFDLDADPEFLEPALAQALRGDIRLAQALSHRGEPGIIAELDLLRSGLSTTSSAGIDVLGMSFFKHKLEEEGAVVVQTPGGARSVLWESLHRESGWFFSSHGYTRVGLAGLVFNPRDPMGASPGEANLIIQIQEGDSSMERDKFVDHLDGLILALAGADALAAIEGPGNEVERLVADTCKGSRAFDDCPIDFLSDPQVTTLVADGTAALAMATASLPGEVGDFVRSVGDLRLMTQSTFEIPASLTGPGTSIVVDYRLDNRALGTLMGDRSSLDFNKAVSAFVQAAEIRRRDSAEEIRADKMTIASDASEQIDVLGRIFEEHGTRYRSLVEAESAVIDTVGDIGSRTLEIRYAVDADNRPIYEQAAARSLTEARSETARQMFDALTEAAKDLGPHREQVVAYGLLALIASDDLEVGLDLDMKTEETAAHWRGQYRAAGFPESLDLFARGSNVAPIDGGLFDVEGIPVLD
ncbi:MAG: hypothetical protein JKY37_18035 [Nannocystaceae bacterium]|nr:hypothetical protein [Nannocystaceae bacterium]